MHDLTTEQLEAIRRLLLDPLRDAIRAEIRTSHERLETALDVLAERSAEHAHRGERRIAAVEREVIRLRSFRRRVLAVYSALAVLLSLIWSALWEKLTSKLTGK